LEGASIVARVRAGSQVGEAVLLENHRVGGIRGSRIAAGLEVTLELPAGKLVRKDRHGTRGRVCRISNAQPTGDDSEKGQRMKEFHREQTGAFLISPQPGKKSFAPRQTIDFTGHPQKGTIVPCTYPSGPFSTSRSTGRLVTYQNWPDER